MTDRFSHEEYLDFALEQRGRFWSKVKADVSGCWLWQRAVCKDGYGKYAIALPRDRKPFQKHVRAHRLAFELANGPADSRLVVMHTCDTPGCVNPNHLRLGTQKENRQDCVRKGRNCRGERVAHAVLNPDLVRKIRRLHAKGVGPKEIVRQVGATYDSVWGVVKGATWRHVA